MKTDPIDDLRLDITAGRWLRANGVRLILALKDTNRELVEIMCTEAFGIPLAMVKAAGEEEQRRRAAEKAKP